MFKAFARLMREHRGLCIPVTCHGDVLLKGSRGYSVTIKSNASESTWGQGSLEYIRIYTIKLFRIQMYVYKATAGGSQFRRRTRIDRLSRK
jgi:hypothetical protein